MPILMERGKSALDVLMSVRIIAVDESKVQVAVCGDVTTLTLAPADLELLTDLARATNFGIVFASEEEIQLGFVYIHGRAYGIDLSAEGLIGLTTSLADAA